MPGESFISVLTHADSRSMGTIVTSLMVAFTYTAARRIQIAQYYGGMTAIQVREVGTSPLLF